MKKNIKALFVLCIAFGTLPLSAMEKPSIDVAQQETSSHSGYDGLPSERTYHIALCEIPAELSQENITELEEVATNSQNDFVNIILGDTDTLEAFYGDQYPLAEVALSDSANISPYNKKQTTSQNQEKIALERGFTWGHTFTSLSSTEFVKATLKDGSFKRYNQSYLNALEQAMKECIKNNDIRSIVEIENLCFDAYDQDYIPLSRQIRQCCYPLAMAHYYKTQSATIMSLDEYEKQKKQSAQRVATQIATIVTAHKQEMDALLIKLNIAQEDAQNNLLANHENAEYVTAFLNRGSKEEEYPLAPKLYVENHKDLLADRYEGINKDIKTYSSLLTHMHKASNTLALNNK